MSRLLSLWIKDDCILQSHLSGDALLSPLLLRGWPRWSMLCVLLNESSGVP